jgi:bifunctional UDP-N-acetylglucosamine pyrophosphorylase / glucosamine-1-phosphate N-acetyltransferase
MDSSTINKIKKKIQLDKEIAFQRVLELIEMGVDVQSPEQLHIRGTVSCGKNVRFDLNVIIEGDVRLGDDVVIGANSILRDCTIGRGSTIKPFSLIENAMIGENCFVGPYGRIRQNVSIEDYVQIGNFVEIKNANIASKCRINHLAFVGDADLGEQVTIGAGTITCNHDGVSINRTSIEHGAYVGSGCNLVAPLIVNANATIASGSTITKGVAADTLTIARSRQITIKDWKGPKPHK